MTKFVFFLMFICTALDASPKPAASYLKGKLEITDKRYDSFLYALELMEERGAITLVETGTARDGSQNFKGDGGSTIIFCEWAKDHNAQFYSVDIDMKAIKRAEKAVGKNSDFVTFVHSDSVLFLQQFNHQIDFLYLDSYDYHIHDPLPSQEHHYNELIAALPWLTDTSIIMIDDCDLPHGGKGKLVIEYLISEGWEIIYDGYQVILTKNRDSIKVD